MCVCVCVCVCIYIYVLYDLTYSISGGHLSNLWIHGIHYVCMYVCLGTVQIELS
jgi:hypothetical protein